MPTARRSRTIDAPLEQLWAVIGDPHHLPRWWPRVERVEDVEDDAFTQVMKTHKGKRVRADFRVRAGEAEHALVWEQQLAGTPFARVLSESETRLLLQRDGERTAVTIELRQRVTGASSFIGGFFVRRAAAATIDEALDGLERIGG